MRRGNAHFLRSSTFLKQCDGKEEGKSKRKIQPRTRFYAVHSSQLFLGVLHHAHTLQRARSLILYNDAGELTAHKPPTTFTFIESNTRASHTCGHVLKMAGKNVHITACMNKTTRPEITLHRNFYIQYNSVHVVDTRKAIYFTYLFVFC